MNNLSKKVAIVGLILSSSVLLVGCNNTPTSDQIQQIQQEAILKEGTAETGMPAIKNFQERKLAKQILELRDKEKLTTYTYIVAEMTGKLVFFCNSIGYGLPYATQYTNPEKVVSAYGSDNNWHYVYETLPQADPNGLFMPSSASATWIMCVDPKGIARPTYVEPNIVVSAYQLQ